MLLNILSNSVSYNRAHDSNTACADCNKIFFQVGTITALAMHSNQYLQLQHVECVPISIANAVLQLAPSQA